MGHLQLGSSEDRAKGEKRFNLTTHPLIHLFIHEMFWVLVIDSFPVSEDLELDTFRSDGSGDQKCDEFCNHIAYTSFTYNAC